MADPINANPTVLNAADLPTRGRRTSSPTSKATTSILFSTTSVFSDHDDDSDYSLDSLTGPVQHLGDENATVEEIDEQEIYDLIAPISDPEHPLSLGSLAVVSLPSIHIHPPTSPNSPIQTVTVLLTPTITHCSLATVIGLGVRVRLEQALPPRFRVDVRIKPGTHASAEEVSKQLADKERVAAALENATLAGVLRKMLETCT